MFRLVVAAGALAALMSYAEAAPRCAPGKIYRVSQKSCVDKSAAVRTGVYASKQARAKNTRTARLEAARQAREERRVARSQASRMRAQLAEKPAFAEETQQPRAIILSPVKTVIGSAASPFGALVDPWRSDRVNAPQETLFSLRVSVEE